jgi:SAM-dependent methyltransferase
MLKHAMLRRADGPHGPYYVDTRIVDPVSVEDFGLQWREFDPYPSLQALSYSHLFGRFLLPQAFFQDKLVVDLGCGNGRLGQFVIPQARGYIGVELSDAITAFQVVATAAAKVDLVRASIEDLPLDDRIADVVICWGALHHVADFSAGLAEIRRIVKPGGTVLIYVYPDFFAERENLNRLLKHVSAPEFRDFCGWFLDKVHIWATTDERLASEVCTAICTGRKPHPAWELLQMFDGLGPEHHHLLEKTVAAEFQPPWHLAATHAGCFVIEAPG